MRRMFPRVRYRGRFDHGMRHIRRGYARRYHRDVIPNFDRRGHAVWTSGDGIGDGSVASGTLADRTGVPLDAFDKGIVVFATVVVVGCEGDTFGFPPPVCCVEG